MLPLRIALRYLLSRKSHTAVNIISMISVAGIAVATAAIVIIMSVFNGFSDLAADKLSVLDPDYAVTRTDGHPIAGADSLCALISRTPGVTLATPMVRRKALVATGDRQIPVTATGLGHRDITALGLDHIAIDGTAQLDTPDMPCVMLSTGTAVGLDMRNAGAGDIYIYEPRRTGRVNPGNPMSTFRSDTLTVSGIYMTGDADTDADGIIVPLAVMRSLLQYDDGRADALRIYTGGHSIAVDRIARLLPGRPADYVIADRIAQHAESYRMISIEKWITLLLLTFVLVIASFNIISTMAMLIIEKQPNMHVMQAMGADRRLTDRIFVWQSRLITLTGGVAGIIIGLALSLAQQYGGFITLQASDPSTLLVHAYPVAVRAGDLAIIAAILVAISLFTSIVTTRALRTHASR